MVKRLTSGAGNQMRAKASNLAKSNKPASLTYKIENIRTKSPTVKRAGRKIRGY